MKNNKQKKHSQKTKKKTQEERAPFMASHRYEGEEKK